MSVRVITGDCREVLAGMDAGSVNCCVTSPPYFGLRDYLVAGQIGLESTPDAYVAELVAVFREVRRVLRDDGTLWLNLGDSYANDTKWGGSTSGKHVQAIHGNSGIGRCRHTTGLPGKNMIGIPWRVAFALQADGWYLRQDIIWSKPNPMPESVTDRCTKSHEYLFLLSKSPRYYYDAAAIAEPAIAVGRIPGGNRNIDPSRGDSARDMSIPVADQRNKRSVWTVPSQPFKDWTQTSRRVRVEPDAVDDGTERTTSPDCPLHGDSSALVSSAACGEHAADLLSCIPRSDVCHGQEQLNERASIVQIHDAETVPGSSDFVLQPCSQTASAHSNQTRKMARDLETTQPYIAFAETPTCTPRTLEELGSADSAVRTFENSNGTADLGDVQASSRHPHIARKSSEPDSSSACTCSYFKTVTESISHFATFPPALIAPCILAGCPVGGTVLDPFGGAGTTGLVADGLQRNAVLIEFNPTYAEMARRRIVDDAPLFAEIAA